MEEKNTISVVDDIDISDIDDLINSTEIIVQFDDEILNDISTTLDDYLREQGY